MQLVYMSETRANALEELSLVSLRRSVKTEDAQIVPAGSTGTIVGVLEEGVAYIVEFTKPFAALVDLAIEDFEVVRAACDGDEMA